MMGGDMQPQGHVQLFLNHVLFGMDIQEAGDAARFRHMDSTDPWGAYRPMRDRGCIMIESGVQEDVQRKLTEMGHQLCEPQPLNLFGGYQAVRWDAKEGVYWGASESRVDGQAGGW